MIVTFTVGLILGALLPQPTAAPMSPADPVGAMEPPAPVTLVAGPCLQSPGPSSMSIMWVTDKPSTGRVEYGRDDSLGLSAANSVDGLLDANQRLHRVTLTGLEPGATYRYRVASTEISSFAPYKVQLGDTVRSEIHSFRTLSPAKPDISFVVLNDNHERTELLRARIERQAARPYDLVFFNGDMLNHVDSEEQVIERIVRPASELFMRHTPLVWVRGNHEARGVYARHLNKFMGPAERRHYYSFDHGPVHFIVMDVGEDKPDTHREYGGLVAFDAYRREQSVWLAHEVKSAAYRKARFRVALMHVPLFASDDGLSARPEQRHGATHARDLWAPLLNRGLDLMLAAHTHRFQIVEPQKGVHAYPVVIGGAPQEGRGTVIRVDANAERLEITVTGDDGGVMATRSIRRR